MAYFARGADVGMQPLSTPATRMRFSNFALLYARPCYTCTHMWPPLASDAPEDKERAARFIARVKMYGPNDCWLWPVLDRAGYGIFFWVQRPRPRKRIAASRACLLLFGAERAPVNMDLACALHSCDVRSCVNPKHLRWGSRAENIEDAKQRHRMPFGSAHHASKLTDSQVEELRELRANGWRLKDLRNKFGVSESTICAICRGKAWIYHKSRNELPKDRAELRVSKGIGSRHHRAKLRETQVREIRELRAKGKTTVDLGHSFGVSSSLVSMICSGRVWKHILPVEDVAP